jgi:hypothetical protein
MRGLESLPLHSLAELRFGAEHILPDSLEQILGAFIGESDEDLFVFIEVTPELAILAKTVSPMHRTAR